MIIIEPKTDRILLRQWRPSDKEPFAALNADPKVMEYFPSVLNRQESDAMADRFAALIAERGWGFWVAELKASGEFLGFVGLHVASDDLPFSPCVEIGWRLAHEHWGKGYTTEAAEEAMGIGFEILGLEEIVAFTTMGNLRSQAVMQRLGMEMAGTFAHPKLPDDSMLKQHCLYRITRKQHAGSKSSNGLIREYT